MRHEWTVVPEKTQDHWLELVGSILGDDDKNVWRSVSVKWGGCIHFYDHANVPLNLRKKGEDAEADCYMHICDIDEMIADLQEIKRMAQAHFVGKDAWPAPPLGGEAGDKIR